MRYFFEISYSGTNYHGWQIQNNAVSIQQTIQDKLSLLLRADIEITGSGRTDAGVHAKQQYFHVDIDEGLDCEDFKYHINAILPFDIAVHSIRGVKENAHARFDAVSRGYIYKVVSAKDPFLVGQAYIYPKNLDIEKLNKAAKILEGKQDFESFSKVKTQVNNFNCEVFNAFWQQDGTATSFVIEANRFLRGMVRAIVGTLLQVNENKISPEEIYNILESKNRSAAGRSVPPQGLYLTSVEYPEQIFEI